MNRKIKEQPSKYNEYILNCSKEIKSIRNTKIHKFCTIIVFIVKSFNTCGNNGINHPMSNKRQNEEDEKKKCSTFYDKFQLDKFVAKILLFVLQICVLCMCTRYDCMIHCKKTNGHGSSACWWMAVHKNECDYQLRRFKWISIRASPQKWKAKKWDR